MSDFKRYFILVTAVMMFGCTEERAEEAAPPPGVDGGSGAESAGPGASGYDYTISLASGGETIYVYYSVQTPLPLRAERFFRVEEGECFRIRGDQFKGLSIFASKGSATIFGAGDDSLSAQTLVVDKDDYKELCYGQLIQCSPDNYAISPRETGMLGATTKWEQFVMSPVEGIEVFKEQCDYFYNIDKWMEFKVKQYVLSGDASQVNVEPTLKAQIDEWAASASQ
ncbi:MAG: hypothetical protein OXK80_00880 [Bdellovibrionales bacterium]|nr:hypothetical protein [Bdellovibrionales bacterium]